MEEPRLKLLLLSLDFNKMLGACLSCCESPDYHLKETKLEKVNEPKYFVKFESMGLTGNESKEEIERRFKELWDEGKLKIEGEK